MTSESTVMKSVRFNCTDFFFDFVGDGNATKDVDLNQMNAYGERMIHIAARNGNLKVINYEGQEIA